eukprot:5737059-Prymnesium_polylepis.1
MAPLYHADAWAVIPHSDDVWAGPVQHFAQVLSIHVTCVTSPLSFAGDRREVSSERIQRSRSGITPPSS